MSDNHEQDGPRHWLWVTRPDYYLEENGEDRESLDPSVEDGGGWWTCHKETRVGDLVLLYRTTPKCDIAYLLQATSDAYSIASDPYAKAHGWEYGCEWQSLVKLKAPVTLAEMRDDGSLEEWNALRGNFQRKAFEVPGHIWDRLMHLLSVRDPALVRVLRRLKRVPPRTLDEAKIEERLAGDLSLLSDYSDSLELVGRQYVLKGHGGRIDLLCRNKTTSAYVVIELKVVTASENTIGQVATYMGWVNENLDRRRRASGLVIAKGFDTRFLAATSAIPGLDFRTLEGIGLR